MAASASLLLLVLLCGALAAEEAGLCVDQPETLNVRINDSVYLPCTYSYTGQNSTVANVSVNWRADPGDRCGASPLIYNGSKNKTNKNYLSRLTLLEDPTHGRGGAIRIHSLTASDVELKYCCRINVTLQNGTTISSQNKHMTKLVLSDNPAQNSVEQVDAIPALVGESVIIPCRFPLNTSNDVTGNWTAGKREGCLDSKDVPTITDANNRYTLKTGNGSISLQIANLSAADSKRYCCSVMLNDGTKIQSSRGTNLIVGDLKSMKGYRVEQKKNITAQIDETVKLNCDFKHPDNRMPLWIGVYLTVGDKLGKFAYHPDQDFIQPQFRGRTHLIRDHGLSSNVSFQIDNVTEKDDKKIYYCLVAFRFCSGINRFTSVIQRGGGTQLMVKGTGSPGPSIEIICSAAVITLVLILIVVLVLKRKGVICAHAANSQKQFRQLADPSKDSHQTEYAEISRANISPKVVDLVVYATLDLTPDKKEDARDRKPNPQNDILYSTVRLT